MSERLHPTYEQHGEKLDLDAETKRNLEHIKDKAETAEVEPENIDKLQEAAHEQAVSAKEITIGEHEQAPQASYIGLQRELKADAYKRTLQKVRMHLSAPEKLLSKVIHKPAVEALDSTSSKTVARPSGILGGGIVSLVGSSLLLYSAKHYGFRYNFFVFFLLFIGGFVLGVVLELLIRLVLHPK